MLVCKTSIFGCYSICLHIYHCFSNLHNLCLTWPPFVATEATFCWLNLHSWWSIPFLPVVSPCFFWWPKTRDSSGWKDFSFVFDLSLVLTMIWEVIHRIPRETQRFGEKQPIDQKVAKSNKNRGETENNGVHHIKPTTFQSLLRPLQHVAAVVIRPCFSIIYHVPQCFMMFHRFPSWSIIIHHIHHCPKMAGQLTKEREGRNKDNAKQKNKQRMEVRTKRTWKDSNLQRMCEDTATPIGQ